MNICVYGAASNEIDKKYIELGEKLGEEIAKRGIEGVMVGQTGCIGICQYEPVVEVFNGEDKVTYVKMTAERAKEVIEKHIKGGNVVTEYTIGENAK